MAIATRRSARSTSVVAALLLILTFGTAGAAFADPGYGNGSDNSQAGANNGNGSDNGSANAADNGKGQADRGGSSSTAGTAGTSAKGSAPLKSSGKSSSTKGSSGKSTKGSSGKASSGKSTRASTAKSTSGSSGKSGKSGKSAGPGDHKIHGTAGISGSTESPQPPSRADRNLSGANGGCLTDSDEDGIADDIYCSTRDGAPSGNGVGGGNAVGKPCAGCVGKADNKNPPGQMQGPSDRNAGYECDRNQGIGKTNPAHTGCKSDTPPDCVETTGEPCTPPPCNKQAEDCDGTPPCVGSSCNPPPCVSTTIKPCGETPPPCAGPSGDENCGNPPPCVSPLVETNGACVGGEEAFDCPNGKVMGAKHKCVEPKGPAVLGAEAFAPRPPAAVKPQEGVLPATGSSAGLGLFAGVGFILLAVGAVAMMRRRTS